MSALSDEHLVKSINAGNKEHARLLYDRYAQYVAGIVIRIIKDAEQTKDLTQETFLRVFKGIKRFKGESSFKTWVTSIAVNICYDHLRMSERRHWKSHDSIDDAGNGRMREIPDTASTTAPQRQLLQKEVETVVATAIDTLSADHKTAILLWLEGFSYAEIAKITNATSETVGSRIFYAKKKLMGLLRRYWKGLKS